jgi:Domain of unknown function (DUF5666)
MNSFTRILGTCLAGAFLLAGCGGGGADSSSSAGINGGGAPVNNNPGGGGGGGGTPTGAFAKGSITAIAAGTVTVNGVAVTTTGAQVVVDDNPGVESDLRVGQVVNVQGTVNTAGAITATRVSFNNDLEGPVASINVAGLSFVVLGQTVFINGTTVFDNSSLPNGFASLAANDVVEVSGFRNTSGDLVATRIEKRTGAVSPFEVNGTVSGLNTTSSTFNLGALSVSYVGVTWRDGSPANAVCVEVKGTQFNAGQLIATSVEVKSCGLGATASSRGEVEGLITTFVSASDFSIGAQRVTTTAGTNLVTNGANVLALNVKVEAEGSFDANGTLVATKVEIKADNSLRVLGNIQVVTGPNTIVVNGVTVTISGSTRQEDKSSANDPSLTFSDLNVGNYVEVRGFNSGTAPNSIAAVIVERDDPDNRFEIQGLAGTLSDPTLVILGVTANTTGAQFRDINDAVITRATFFAQANGKLVKVRGRTTPVLNQPFIADDEVQLETP